MSCIYFETQEHYNLVLKSFPINFNKTIHFLSVLQQNIFKVLDGSTKIPHNLEK